MSRKRLCVRNHNWSWHLEQMSEPEKNFDRPGQTRPTTRREYDKWLAGKRSMMDAWDNRPQRWRELAAEHGEQRGQEFYRCEIVAAAPRVERHGELTRQKVSINAAITRLKDGRD